MVDTRFHFRAMSNGSVTMFRDTDVDGLPAYWTVYYADGKINISDGGHNPNQMVRATEAQKARVIKWYEETEG